MPKRKITPAYIAAHIRRVLKDGGSAPHAEGVQWFFKEKVKSRGWYTAELRKVSAGESDRPLRRCRISPVRILAVAHQQLG